MTQSLLPSAPGLRTLRPNRDDPRVAAGVVKLLAPKMKDWVEVDGATTSDQAICEDLAVALTDANDWDGYSLASFLESQASWSPDAALVEILNLADDYRYQVEREIVSQWIQETGLKSQHTIGDVVKVRYLSRGMGPAGRKPVEYMGAIWQVYRDTGKYVVNVPELGHAKPGEMGLQGLVLTWEEVDGWNASIAGA